jgi:NAD-dependent deacetylase
MTPGYRSLVVLTGAGISAESGLATFRASDGLWCNHRVEDVATPEGFARNPKRVQDFYNMRRAQLANVRPNAAHHALAELASRWEGNFLLVTQNVDDLHDRAMTEREPGAGFRLLHMHGELTKARCVETERVCDWREAITEDSRCACCNETGTLRPHIVWFGEMPLEMEFIYSRLASCDLFISIGTSGNVYPAAGFVQAAKMAGARTVELNLEPSQGSFLFDEHIHGPATQIVSEYVKGLGVGIRHLGNS